MHPSGVIRKAAITEHIFIMSRFFRIYFDTLHLAGKKFH